MEPRQALNFAESRAQLCAEVGHDPVVLGGRRFEFGEPAGTALAALLLPFRVRLGHFPRLKSRDSRS